MLIALENGRPDRLPCQVHGWMDYYLNHYLGGIDWYEAYAKFGMDYAIYVSPDYTYAGSDQGKWQADRRDLGLDLHGNHTWEETITTPKGKLHHAGAYNEITRWETEHLIKNEADFGTDSTRFLWRPTSTKSGLLGKSWATKASCAAIPSARDRGAHGRASVCLSMLSPPS